MPRRFTGCSLTKRRPDCRTSPVRCAGSRSPHRAIALLAPLASLAGGVARVTRGLALCLQSERGSCFPLRPLGSFLPLTGGAFTQAAPHPIVARRTWLWRADTGRVIEALGFGFGLPASPDGNSSDRNSVGRDWLAGLGGAVVHEYVVGGARDGTVLGWAAARPFNEPELELLREVARFAAAPLAALAARATLSVLLETYLGRRSAAQVLAGRLRREPGETIRAALLYADLRGFTELSA